MIALRLYKDAGNIAPSIILGVANQMLEKKHRTISVNSHSEICLLLASELRNHLQTLKRQEICSSNNVLEISEYNISNILIIYLSLS